MRMTFGILALVAAAGSASADITLNANLLAVMPLGQASQGVQVVGAGATYSNVSTFSGSGFANGGATAISGILTTKYVSEEITMTAAQPNVTGFTFSVANFNSTAVSARARIRFHLPDGGGTTTGTYITGFSFNPISFPVGVSLWSTTTAAFALPANLFMGMTFDNSGAAATTAAQLNNLGEGLFNPPDVGSSPDLAFQTSAASVGNVTAAPGSSFNFGGAPVANFGWEIVPAPASMALLGMGGLVLGRRRR